MTKRDNANSEQANSVHTNKQPANKQPLVEINNLRISFPSEDHGMIETVRGVSFIMGREKLGIVGESGSGKSLTGRALMGVLPSYAKVTADKLQFSGLDLLSAPEHVLRKLRGNKIGMVLQDPKFSLNPVHRVGDQITESIAIGTPSLSKSQLKSNAIDILEAVEIREPDRVFSLYPHEVSGGMGQRIMIAMTLVREPDLLIADELTSALDVTVQAKVLTLLDELVTRRNMGLIFISHDLNLVSKFCDRVLVMYSGRIVEEIDAKNLKNAQHAYTKGLLNCMPRIDGPLDPLPTLKRQEAWLNEPKINQTKLNQTEQKND